MKVNFNTALVAFDGPMKNDTGGDVFACDIAIRGLGLHPTQDGDEKIRRYLLAGSLYEAQKKGVEADISEGELTTIRNCVKAALPTFLVGPFHEFAEKALSDAKKGKKVKIDDEAKNPD